jgi:hypothetical protein
MTSRTAQPRTGSETEAAVVVVPPSPGIIVGRDTGTPRAATPGAAELLAQATVGALSLVTRVVLAALSRGEEGEPRPDDDAFARLSLATMGLALGMARSTARALTWSTRAATLAGSVALDLAPAPARRPFEAAAAGWREQRRATDRELLDAETVAEDLVRELVPRVVSAVLDQLDLTRIVTDRVDIDRVAAALDLDALVGRVDIARIVERVDVDAVAARLDVDAVAARLDVEAVIARLDLSAIAREVLDEIDLPEIIRESSGAMASETVRGVRMQSIDADRAVSRAIDRMLLRHRERATDAPGEAEAEQRLREERDHPGRTE